MQTNLYRKFEEIMKHDQRDIALIAYPGMGLSTLLRGLSDQFSTVFLPIELIKDLWQREYEKRSKGRRFVLHASLISTLNSYFELGPLPDKELFQTNLSRFLQQHTNISETPNPLLILIDRFSELPSALAKILCDELKSIRDSEANKYPGFENIRIVIGGAIDFDRLYGTITTSGVSPATNFRKCYPSEFLLSDQEAHDLLRAEARDSKALPVNVKQMIVQWSNGYVYYIVQFIRWIDHMYPQYRKLGAQSVIRDLQVVLQEQNRISLFAYCDYAWLRMKTEERLIEILRIAISSGYVRDFSGQTIQLAELGVLLKPHIRDEFYYPANILVQLYFRQRLSECSILLPISDSTLWCLSYANVQAYTLILEIENHLRTFIADQLFAHHGSNWIMEGLGQVRINGESILESAESRLRLEHESPYYVPDSVDNDNILMFLDFGDLVQIVDQNRESFKRTNLQKFADHLPNHIALLNFLRRRIAHNRPITMQQVEALRQTWQLIRGVMRPR